MLYHNLISLNKLILNIKDFSLFQYYTTNKIALLYNTNNIVQHEGLSFHYFRNFLVQLIYEYSLVSLNNFSSIINMKFHYFWILNRLPYSIWIRCSYDSIRISSIISKWRFFNKSIRYSSINTNIFLISVNKFSLKSSLH